MIDKQPKPEHYADPFEYALAVVWSRWHEAAEECQRHQVGQTYEVGHEHGALAAIKRMRSMLDDLVAKFAEEDTDA